MKEHVECGGHAAALPVKSGGMAAALQIGAVVLLLALPLAAQTQKAGGGEEKELSDLLSIMQQETEVATKTRLNSDYVPGIVTVLQGDDLEALGIATAAEALGLVPGMQAVLDPRAAPAVIVRGIDFPFNSGNIQILVNGVPLTREDAGINSSALLIPVEQIDRIEVIRGPGSVVYGNFAFMGLVNIITRKDGDRVYLRDANRMHSGGGRVAWNAGGTKFSANVSHALSGDAPVAAPLRDVDEKRWFGALSAERGGLSLSLQTTDRRFDPHIAAPIAFDETTWAADGRYTRELAPKLRADAEVSYLHSNLTDSISLLQGDLTKFSVDAVWDRFARHSLLIGADYSISTIDRADHATPPAPGTPPGPIPLQTIASNVDRRITGFLLQDRFDARDNVSITAGARYDSYSDYHTRITPRVAVVWRITDHHILKAGYAEGYRPPTFFELYTPPAPGTIPRYPFEVNRTSELNYVFHGVSNVFRATLFRSVISDMLRPGGVVTPGRARSWGYELEWSQQVFTQLKLDANLSHVHTVDPRATGFDAPDAIAPQWLANIAAYWQPVRDTIAGLRWNIVGGRPSGSDIDTLDLTLSRQNLIRRGLTARVGIKDAFNHPVTYLNNPPVGAVTSSTFPGRTVWAEVSWRR